MGHVPRHNAPFVIICLKFLLLTRIYVWERPNGKKAAGLLADACIKFPQIAGITHVVSCQWSYMC